MRCMVQLAQWGWNSKQMQGRHCYETAVFLFCSCLLLFGFVNNIIKGQQHESDFISFLSLFVLVWLSLISYLLIFLSLAHILLEDIWTIFYCG